MTDKRIRDGTSVSSVTGSMEIELDTGNDLLEKGTVDQVATYILNNVTVTGTFTSRGIDDNATGERLELGDGAVTFGDTSGDYFVTMKHDTGIMKILGSNSSLLGSQVWLYASANPAGPDLDFRSPLSNIRAKWDSSLQVWDYQGNEIVGLGDLTTTAGPKILGGSGTPEAAVTAPVGSLFMRSDGGASTSFYVKESGAGNTGWVAK